MKTAITTLFFLFFIAALACCQISATMPVKEVGNTAEPLKTPKTKMLYGTASYYADKLDGRKTATGATYNHTKMTAACNVLPLGTWIRVTNLRNKKSVVVQVNDRLHPKNKRIVDMSQIAADRLGYIARGLTQVTVEVLSAIKTKK